MPTGVTRFRLKQLLLFVTALCVAAACLRTPFLQMLNNRWHSDWVRASPFTDVRVERDVVLVEFDGARYELVSINGATSKDILRSARRRYGSLVEKRFIEDLPEVLGGLGMSPNESTVELVLRDSTGKKVEVADAPMTAENRSRVYRSNSNRRTSGQLPFGYADAFFLAFVFIAIWGRIPSRVIAAVSAFRSKSEPGLRSGSTQ